MAMSEQATAPRVTVPFEYESKNLTISVNVSDLQRSIDWYREVLGFAVEYRMDEIGWCELTTPFGAVNIGLSQTEDQRAGGTVPTFGVKDIAAALRHLEAQDVKRDEIFDVQGMVKLLGFYDPDGNPWMFAETTQTYPGKQ
jgi:catechol 2,3-dioxygenase-like lactoylglutathione lyase family enzyme